MKNESAGNIVVRLGFVNSIFPMLCDFWMKNFMTTFLAEKFDIKPIGTVEADLKSILSN